MLKVVYLLLSLSPGHAPDPSWNGISYSKEECEARRVVNTAEAKRREYDVKYECHRYILKD